jgi:hypothetical protein
MGSKSHLKPGEYSRKFNDFLVKLVAAQDGRPTARWAERNLPSERGKDYWQKLFDARQAMTTEDIALLARWMGVSPITFVRAAHAGDVSLLGVSGLGDTDPLEVLTAAQEEELRSHAVALAAKESSQRK